MPKKYLQENIRKLDNTAKIFSLDYRNNANIFRISVVLKEDVNVNILSKALEISLKRYKAFKVKINTGVFWNYFEFNDKKIIVEEDKNFSCKSLNPKENNDYLLKVTYYKNKINLDMYHALTDGNGAIIFLKSIIANYLDLKNNIPIDETIISNVNYEDQYLKNYDKNLKEPFNFKNAYSLPQKFKKNTNNSYHYIININKLKSVCKSLNTTITEFLTAMYIYAIYLTLYKKETKKEIVVTVPIDLRGYYQVDTLSNFFVCTNINPKIKEKNLTVFEDILKSVKEEFKEKTKEFNIKKYLARDVKMGMNVAITVIPLFIKKSVMNFIGSIFKKSSTSTLSNVGIVTLEEKYKKEIDNIFALVLPTKLQKLKCTICSFDENINVIINSTIDDLEFEKNFLNLLQSKINNVKFNEF